MSALLCLRQRERDAKPAAVCMLCPDASVHPLRRFFHHGKPDAAAARRILPGAVRAVAELKYFFQLCVLHTGAVIGNGNQNRAAGQSCKNVHMTRAVFPAVIQQIGNAARKQLPVGENRTLGQLRQPDIQLSCVI